MLTVCDLQTACRGSHVKIMSHAFIVCLVKCQTDMSLEDMSAKVAFVFPLLPTEMILLRYTVLICFPPHTFSNNGIPLVSVRLPH